MSDAISEPVRRIIAENIGSVSELEAILLLRRNRHRAWTVAEAAERLYVSADALARLFTSLVLRGFFSEHEGRYQYAAAPEVEATIAVLAADYTRDVVAVTNLIHAKAATDVLKLAEMSQRRKREK